MTAALQALRAPWQWRRNSRSRWAAWGSVAVWALLLGVPTVGVALWGPSRLAWIVVSLAASTAVMLVWGHQFAALLRLDHPHAARLVPGHGRVLRRTAVGLWSGLVALCAAVAAVAVASLFGETAMAVRTLQLVALGAGAALLFVGLALRWWWLWVGVWLVPAADHLPGLRSVVRPIAALAREQWLATPWLGTAMALLAMGVVLVSVFGRGGAGHASSYASVERMRRAFEGGSSVQGPTLDAYGHWGEWLSRPLRRLTDAWLARTLAHAVPGLGSVMSRAEVALHGSQHWVRQVGIILPLPVVGALVLVIVRVAAGDGAPQGLQQASFGIGIGLVCMLIGIATGWPGALWTSRREQALLMLLPGMPRGVALNRALALRHTRSYLLMWGALLPLFVVLAWGTGALYPLAMPVVALPMVAWLWRDVSRLRGPSPAGTAAPFFVCLTLGVASSALLREKPESTLPWLAVVALVSAPWVVWRWRRLVRLPQALPAGRLWGSTGGHR